MVAAVDHLVGVRQRHAAQVDAALGEQRTCSSARARRCSA